MSSYGQRVPRTGAQARAQQDQVYVTDYGEHVQNTGTGLTYEDYCNAVIPGTEMPQWQWEALPDAPSIQYHNDKQNVKRERALKRYQARVGNYVPDVMFHNPPVEQVYADPYMNSDGIPPFYHDPQTGKWS